MADADDRSNPDSYNYKTGQSNGFREGYAKGILYVLDTAEIECTYHVHTDDCYINHPAKTGTYTNIRVTDSGDWGVRIQATCSSCGHITTSDVQPDNVEHEKSRLKDLKHTCKKAYTEWVCGKTEESIESATVNLGNFDEILQSLGY